MGSKDILLLAVVGIAAFMVLKPGMAAASPSTGTQGLTVNPSATVNTGSGIKDEVIAAMAAATAIANAVSSGINSMNKNT